MASKWKENGAPTYEINKDAPPGSPGNLYDTGNASPGLYNSYFNVCGNDDPTSLLENKRSLPDMSSISANIRQAADVSFESKFHYLISEIMLIITVSSGGLQTQPKAILAAAMQN